MNHGVKIRNICVRSFHVNRDTKVVVVYLNTEGLLISEDDIGLKDNFISFLPVEVEMRPVNVRT